MVEGDCDEVRDTQSCGRKLSVRCDASSFFLLSLLIRFGEHQKWREEPGIRSRALVPARCAGAPDAGSHPEALSQRIHSLCRCSQKKSAGLVSRLSNHVLHGEKSSQREVAMRLFSVRASTQRAPGRVCVWTARLSPPQSFTRCTALATLVFSLPVFFSKPFSILSPLQAFHWVLPRPSHKTDFGISNNSSPAVVRAGGQILDFSNHTEYIQCKGPILTFLFSH